MCGYEDGLRAWICAIKNIFVRRFGLFDTVYGEKFEIEDVI